MVLLHRGVVLSGIFISRCESIRLGSLSGDCDILVTVSPLVSDNLNGGLMTVKASSAHGIDTKKITLPRL